MSSPRTPRQRRWMSVVAIVLLPVVGLAGLCVPSPVAHRSPDSVAPRPPRTVASAPDRVALTGAPERANLTLTALGLPSNMTWRFGVWSCDLWGCEFGSAPVSGNRTSGDSLSAGTWYLNVFPPPSYVAYPATAVFFAHANESINQTIQFLPSEGCFLNFTEVGLPVGTTWWVAVNNVAYFSNGTTISALGCGFTDPTFGSAAGYVVVGSSAGVGYKASGESLAVVFAPGASAPSGEPISAVWLLLSAALVGGALSAAWVVGRLDRD